MQNELDPYGQTSVSFAKGHAEKSDTLGCEVRSVVSLMRKSHECADGVENIGDHPVGCVKLVLGNEFPNVLRSVNASGWKA